MPVILLHRYLYYLFEYYCDSLFDICKEFIIYILMLWVFTPCSLVVRYGHFLGTCGYRLQDYNIRFSYTRHCHYPSATKKEEHVRYLSTRPHCVPTRRTFKKSRHANL